MKQSIELEKLLEFINENYGNSKESFIYRWYHPELNLYYIGSHKGSIDDGYKGSGTDFQKLLEGEHPTIEGIYPIEEWEREILTYCTEEHKCGVEEIILKAFDAAKNPYYLNKTNATKGWGKGKDHYRYDTGLFVGEPHSSAGSKKRREWWRKLPEEHLREIRLHQKKQRERYKREKELREVIIGWGLNSEDRSKLCIQYQSDDELKKIKLEQLEQLYKDICEKAKQLNGGPILLKFFD